MILFIDREEDIKDIDLEKFEKVFLLNPSRSWEDTDKIETTPACYALCRNAEKFSQIRFEAEALDNNNYLVFTKNPESFIIYQDVTFGRILGFKNVIKY